MDERIKAPLRLSLILSIFITLVYSIFTIILKIIIKNVIEVDSNNVSADGIGSLFSVNMLDNAPYFLIGCGVFVLSFILLFVVSLIVYKIIKLD